MTSELYWNEKFGILTVRDRAPWNNDREWFGQFQDKIGTVVNLPLSTVTPYNFQDGELFAVIDIVDAMMSERDYAEEAYNEMLMHEE